MKSIYAFALAAIFSSSAANATLLTFDSLSGSQGSSFSIGDVTISTVGGVGDIGAEGTPNGTVGLLEGSSPRLFMGASFLGGTSSVSVDLGDFDADSDTIFLEAYDASDTLLGSTSADLLASFTGMVTLSLSFANIDHVVFGSTASVNGSSVYADNLYYVAAAVPEPETYAMLLAGLGLLGWHARRRKKQLS